MFGRGRGSFQGGPRAHHGIAAPGLPAQDASVAALVGCFGLARPMPCATPRRPPRRHRASAAPAWRCTAPSSRQCRARRAGPGWCQHIGAPSSTRRLSTARASATMAAWRWRTMPSCPSVSPSAWPAQRLRETAAAVRARACRWARQRSTSRWPSVRAAATVICWPSTARTASSSPSKAPGTRRPSPSGKVASSTALMAARVGVQVQHGTHAPDHLRAAG